MMNLFTTSGIIGDALTNTFYSIFLIIDSIVYWFISICYQVFVLISQVNLFSESDLRNIIDRVFTILGVVMLFIMAYQIIILIIDTDKAKGENGAKKTVVKIITSIVLIVLLPTIYRYMGVFQNDVLTSNVIGRVVMGGGTTTESNNDYIKKSGTEMAVIIASAFFHPIKDGVEYSYIACLEDDAPSICTKYNVAYNAAIDNNAPGEFFMNSDLQDSLKLDFFESIFSTERQMKYIPILSTIAALLAIKMIIAFSLDIGVRVAKLGFLQIVAPIPIALNIGESQSIFQTKWFKNLTDTYLDVFMKLIVIYFSMFSITMVPNVLENLWPDNGGFIIKLFATVIVILGILQFAKDGPKLIKDLFNMDLDFSIKKRLNENTYAQRAASVVGGGISSGVSNFVNKYRSQQDPNNKHSVKNFTAGVGKGLVSGVGGLFGGGARGWKHSDGIDNWNKVGAASDKARKESDYVRTNNERLRQRGIDNHNTAFGGQAVPFFTRAAGAVNEFREDSRSAIRQWALGEASTEKLQAAQLGHNSFESFTDNMTKQDRILKAVKQGRDDALAKLYQENSVNDDILKSFRDANNGKYNNVENNDILANNKEELATYIEKYYKKIITDRTISNFKKNSVQYKAEVDKLAVNLKKSFSSLGQEFTRNALKDNGFDNFDDLVSKLQNVTATTFADTYEKAMKVKSVLNDQVKIQSAKLSEEKAKENK